MLVCVVGVVNGATGAEVCVSGEVVLVILGEELLGVTVVACELVAVMIAPGVDASVASIPWLISDRAA